MNSSMTSSVFSADSLEDQMLLLEFPAFRDQMQQTFDDYVKTLTQIINEKSKLYQVNMFCYEYHYCCYFMKSRLLCFSCFLIIFVICV